MYRPPFFAVDDLPVLHDAIRKRVFATIATQVNGAIEFAYAPVVLDLAEGPRGGVRYHLARGNTLAALEDGARVKLSFIATDAYVSPDWYRALVTVPTWNYIAVEGEGVVKRTSRKDLLRLVVDLSAQEEAKLYPKEPWQIAKLPDARVEALLNGIAGFSVAFETLHGKFKLSQDKKPEDIQGVIAGLEGRDDPASLAVAAEMRKALP
ncbi:MAG TPA: FMN-binding negative transcriptional regulator [Rhizomicrobium sp.]|jgi:transcriptional regulator